MIWCYCFLLLFCSSGLAEDLSFNATFKRNDPNVPQNHINLALETVLEFSKRDQKSDIELINNVQNFLDKVKMAITPSTTTTERTTVTKRTTTTKTPKRHHSKHQKKLFVETEEDIQANDESHEPEEDSHKKNKHKRKPKGHHKSKTLNPLELLFQRNDEKKTKQVDTKNTKGDLKLEDTRFKKVVSKFDGKNQFRKPDTEPLRQLGMRATNLKNARPLKRKAHQNPNMKSNPRLDAASATDFFTNIAGTLHSLSDDDIYTIIETADDEIRKSKCVACNVEDDSLIRRTMTQGLDVLRRTPMETIREYLQYLIKAPADDEINDVRMSFPGMVGKVLRQLVTEVSPAANDRVRQIMGSLRQFLVKFLPTPPQATNKPPDPPVKKSLVEIVRDAIRTMIFENYSSLDTERKGWIKEKLKGLLKEAAKYKNKISEIPATQKEQMQSAVASKFNNGFKNWLHSLFQGDTLPGRLKQEITRTVSASETQSTTLRYSIVGAKNKPSVKKNPPSSDDDTHGFVEDEHYYSDKKEKQKKKPTTKKKKTKTKKQKQNKYTDSVERTTGAIKTKKDKKKGKDKKRNKDDKDEIDKNWREKVKKMEKKEKHRKEKLEVDQNWKKKLLRKEKENIKHDVDWKWQQKEIEKLKKKKSKMLEQKKKLKPSKGKMKASIQEYMDKIGKERDAMLQEEDESDSESSSGEDDVSDKQINIEEDVKSLITPTDKVGIVPDSSEKPTHFRQRDIDFNEWLKYRSNKNEPSFEEISIEIMRRRNSNITVNASNITASSTVKTSDKTSTDVAKVKTSSKFQTYRANSGLYIPKSRRMPPKQNIDIIIHSIDTNPIPPIQYEFTDKTRNKHFKSNQGSSHTVNRNYLSTLFTTKGAFRPQPINIDNEIENVKTNNTTNVPKEAEKNKTQPTSKQNQELIEKLSKVEQNFEKYKEMMQSSNETVTAASKNESQYLTSTTSRILIPSTVDFFKRRVHADDGDYDRNVNIEASKINNTVGIKA